MPAVDTRRAEREDGARTPEPGESDALAASAQRTRSADRELAAALRRPEPAGHMPDAGYWEALVRRRPLRPERERTLVAAAKGGDATARAALVEAYMPLVAGVARDYRVSPNVDRNELLQEGVVGLLRALERYDPSTGTPFWAYAQHWVRRSVQQLVAELTRPTVLSERALRHLSRLKAAWRDLYEERHREPTRDELAERAGLSPDEVSRLLEIERMPRSTEAPLLTEDGTVWGLFEEVLADPLADGEYERVLDAMEAQELVGLLSGLSERERMILRARYGLDGEEQTRAQVAERLGISPSRVREIERRALGKLAAAAGANGSASSRRSPSS
ncbi:MAG: polymerase primary sigma factor [Solirubrobacteraceae bacterium]|jgi:RNA polymerase sigma factor (sigma-70 family)|nr:polymerase primary sigma factor [Solirubrobacteraceae bacterium]